MTETVLVTGGSGYLAGHCIALLLRRGYNVRATLRSAAKAEELRSGLASLQAPTDHLTFPIADLCDDAGWDAALDGCEYVLHVASPLGNDGARGAQALMVPAADGTLRVLRSATRAKVRRVVMTSSTAACTPPSVDQVGDESVWTGDAHPTLNAYRRSKIAAERAAWDFMASAGPGTTLTTILPGAIFGPVFSLANLGSVQFIDKLIKGKLPGIPRLGFCIADVRDLAELHVRAMLAPEAAGERFIAVGDFLWMEEIARALRSELGDQGAQVPTRGLPDFVLRTFGCFSSSVRALTPLLGRRQLFSSSKARRVLGYEPRPALTTVVDCARSLLEKSAG